MLAVAINAGVIIYMSFGNTAKIAVLLGLPSLGTAFLVEFLFGLLLFLRSKQRALQRNVPIFLNLGYFIVFCIVTAVNMYGLSLKNPTLGSVAGITISGSMWLLESILVWLFTRSHEPYKKSLLRKKIEAFKEAWEMKTIQEIEWIKYDARRPNTKLVKKIRKKERKRKKIIGDDLPEFFRYLEEKDPIKEIVVELERTKPQTIDVEPEPEKETAEIVPIRRIGFHTEPEMKPKCPAKPFQPNLEKRQEAIQTAKVLFEELGRIPTKKELMNQGLSEYYAKWAQGELKKGEQ